MMQIITKGTAKTVNVSSIICDSCGDEIADGTVALAVTMFKGGDMRPRDWEQEYGTVLPEEAAKMERTLTKEGP